MSNRSCRWIIYDLFDFSAPAPHGITQVDLSLLLLLLAPAVPYAAAQTSTESPTSQYPYENINPSMGIIMAVLVCAFLFMAVCSIYIRQCADNATEAGNSRYSAAAARLRRSARGLDPKLIDSFPMFHYSEVKDLKIGKGALECAVCINEFEDEETLRLLPKCDHVFHLECIDAWLASHTTCPVCRGNLIPTSDEISGDPAQGTESNNSTDEHNFTSELSQVHNQNQISINVDEDQNRDPQVSGVLKQNRQREAKFPRSHSTGHSLVQLGENCDRYTLRLPEEVRKQIMSQRLKRTTSCVFVFPTEGSSRGGYRTGGEGSGRGVGRSDRWVFTTTPPFFSKTRSVMSPKVGVNGDVTAVGTSKLFLTSVKTPFDCLAVKGDGVEQISTRPPV